MGISKGLSWIFPGLLGCICMQARAATPAAFNIDPFAPPADTGGFVQTYSAIMAPKGNIGATLWLNAVLDPLHMEIPELDLPPKNVVTGRFSSQLSASYAFHQRIQAGISIPFVLWQQGLDTGFTHSVVGFSGLKPAFGDITLHGRGLIFGQQGARPAFAAFLDLRLPTGEQKKLAGEASVVARPGAAANYSLGRYILAGHVAVPIRFVPMHIREKTIPTQVEMALGFSAPIGPWDQRSATFAIAEISGEIPRAIGEFRLGIRQRMLTKHGPLNLVFLAGVGLSRKLGQPLGRLVIGIDFMTKDPLADADMDDVIDSLDLCPRMPEDMDGFQDNDGCSDPDNDKDGRPDEDDDCPDEAEDKDGIQDWDGCPDPNVPDSDGDGLLDNEDKCKDAAEDYDGFEDSDGCPDLDNDRDGLPDLSDVCPDAAEDKNHFQDDDGCPDGGKRPQLFSVNKDNEIELYRHFQFEKNSEALSATNDKLLNELAGFFRRNTQVVSIIIKVIPEQKRHSSEKLAVARAKNLAQELYKRGVSPGIVVSQSGEYDRKTTGTVALSITVEKRSPQKTHGKEKKRSSGTHKN